MTNFCCHAACSKSFMASSRNRSGNTFVVKNESNSCADIWAKMPRNCKTTSTRVVSVKTPATCKTSRDAALDA